MRSDSIIKVVSAVLFLSFNVFQGAKAVGEDLSLGIMPTAASNGVSTIAPLVNQLILRAALRWAGKRYAVVALEERRAAVVEWEFALSGAVKASQESGGACLASDLIVVSDLTIIEGYYNLAIRLLDVPSAAVLGAFLESQLDPFAFAEGVDEFFYALLSDKTGEGGRDPSIAADPKTVDPSGLPDVNDLTAATGEAEKTKPLIKDPLPMIRLDGGRFIMGSAEGEKNERPAHEVLVRPLLVSAVEMTSELVARFLSERIVNVSYKNISPSFSANSTEYFPSFLDALLICNRLSEEAGLSACYEFSQDAIHFDQASDGYRLPTEAEWEYIARTAAFSFLDLFGSRWEWCWDFYAKEYYSVSPSTNPTGPAEGKLRVLRGGAYSSSQACRTPSYRGFALPSTKREDIGFRLVRNAD